MSSNLTIKSFKTQAAALCSGGYRIVPINAGRKAPLIKGWQAKTFTADDVTAGVGVLCGQGEYPISAIDIDFLDADLAAKMADWCHDTFGMTVERQGNAPKTLLVYRSAEAMTKRTGRWFSAEGSKDRQRVEVLGTGQQFVAYHIHPETKKPYEWVDLIGGLEGVNVKDLPIVSSADIDKMLEVFETMAIEAGYVVAVEETKKSFKTAKEADPEDFLAGMSKGIDLKEVIELLPYINAEGYERWLQVGMALHAEYHASDAALDAWIKWSSGAPNFAGESDLKHRWSGFVASPTGTTILSVLKWGNDAKKKAKTDKQKESIAERIDLIDACDDPLALEATLAKIAKTLDASEVITVAQIKAAAKTKYKALVGQTLPESSANLLLGLGRDTSVENLERQLQYTEFGNARKMVDMYGDDIMYAADTDSWYRWTGTFWRKSTAPEIEQLAKSALMSLLGEGDGNLGADHYDFVRASMTNRMMVSMIKIIRTEPVILVNTHELDLNKNVLGCANGAVDLTNGKLLKPNRLERITIASDTKYDPSATCPVFVQTVRDAFYDNEPMVAFFQRLMGYTLLADPSEDLIVIPYGTGSNGKSTILGAIRDALGGHAVTAGNETFMGSAGSNAGAPRDDVLRLRGRRFVYVTEPDDDKELREGLIKSMTGGEEMSARTAYSSTYVQFTPTWTVILPTNHKPIIKGDDFGIWRRIMLIPFLRNFSTDDTIVKDNARGDKLALELEGILTWLVQGALEYQRVGLSPPPEIEAARDEYKKDMDLLAEWLEESCEVGRDLAASNNELWASWKLFAEARGELRFISNARTLNKKLEARTYVKRIKNEFGIRGRGLRGVAVKDDFEVIQE